jgi:hypothetical protein
MIERMPKLERIKQWRWEPPPGVSIAMLGLGAVLYGALADKPRPLVKGLWIGAFSLFVAAEIAVLYKERAKQTKAYLEQMQSIEDLRQTADAKLTAMLRLLSAINDPAEGLKRRALQFSESLLAFVYDRLQHSPKQQATFAYSGASNRPANNIFTNVWEGGVFGQAWEEITQVNKYQAETLEMYADRFSKNVGQIRNEFSEHGLTDQQLDSTRSAVKGPQDIRLIAERIGD